MSLLGQELFACLERDHQKRSRDEEKKKPTPKEARKVWEQRTNRNQEAIKVEEIKAGSSGLLRGKDNSQKGKEEATKPSGRTRTTVGFH